ncbi:YHS domain-containing protein [bacterium]|nr:YHS domain-containing protein [bacterium]
MSRTLAIVTALLLAIGLTACDKPKEPKAGEPKKPVVKQAKATEGKAQATCPLMGGKIVKTIFADHDGKRVYFCCDSCIAKFKAEPEKFIKKMEDEGIVLAKAPAAAKHEKKDGEDHTGHNHK